MREDRLEHLSENDVLRIQKPIVKFEYLSLG